MTDGEKVTNWAGLGTRYCAACGKDMMDPKTKVTFIGMEIDFRYYKTKGLPDTEFYKKQFGMYSELLDNALPIGICWECWLKSLGVKLLSNGGSDVADS